MENYDFCITGDFSIPHVNWISRVSPNADETSLLSMTTENFLFHFVSSSTQKHDNKFDLCFVTNDYFYSVELTTRSYFLTISSTYYTR